MKKKYLLCRPRGGLNDTLNQVEKCWRYSLVFNRTLIVDTNHLISGGISIAFDEVFKKRNANKNVLLSVNNATLDKLNRLESFPNFVKGRLKKYKLKFDHDLNSFVDSDYNKPITFDFNNDYVEDLIVHDKSGGDTYGINCLERLVFTDSFKLSVLKKIIPLIGIDYISIHIRNTDYETDYKTIFESIYDRMKGQKILVCSDSFDVVRYSKQFFDNSEVITLSMPHDTGGRGHANYATYFCDDSMRRELMVNAFADLFGMAKSSEMIFTRLKRNDYGDGIGGFSGFAHLANSLRANFSIMEELF